MKIGVLDSVGLDALIAGLSGDEYRVIGRTFRDGAVVYEPWSTTRSRRWPISPQAGPMNRTAARISFTGEPTRHCSAMRWAHTPGSAISSLPTRCSGRRAVRRTDSRLRPDTRILPVSAPRRAGAASSQRCVRDKVFLENGAVDPA
jgi:hypothetical protein